MNNEDIYDHDEELIRLLAEVKPIDIQFKPIVNEDCDMVGFRLLGQVEFRCYKIDWDKENVISVCKKKYIPYIRQKSLRDLRKYREWRMDSQEDTDKFVSGIAIAEKVIKKKYSCKNIGFLIDVSNYGNIII